MSTFIEMYYKEHEITVFDNYNYASQAKRVSNLAQVHEIDCAENKRKLDTIFRYYHSAGDRFDAVIVAHAETHNCNSVERPGDFVQSNIVGVYNMLEMVRKYEINNTLWISTDETIKHKPPVKLHKFIKPTFQWSRIKEEESVLAPTSPYSSTKAAGELLVNSWRETYKIPNMTIIRPCNQFGAFQNEEKLIPMCLNKLSRGEKIPLFKTPAYRDWMYVEDLCRALNLLLTLEDREDLYHISAYNEMETKDVVQVLLDKLGKKFDDCVGMVEDRPAYDLYYSLDSSKLRSRGWKPQVSFEEGIERTINWYTEKFAG